MYYRSDMSLNLDAVPEDVLKEIFLLEDQQKRLLAREQAQEKFMAYAKHVYDGFIEGTHHRIIGKARADSLGRTQETHCKYATPAF